MMSKIKKQKKASHSITQLILGNSIFRYAGFIDLSCFDGDGFKLYILRN